MACNRKQESGDTLSPQEWREHYIEQLGSTINYILGLSTASLGFCATQLHDEKLAPTYRLPFLLLTISVLCGIGCSIFRMYIFRLRHRELQEDKEMNDSIVFWLFIGQIGFFAAGVAIIGGALLKWIQPGSVRLRRG